jgi:hypothetical protein
VLIRFPKTWVLTSGALLAGAVFLSSLNAADAGGRAEYVGGTLGQLRSKTAGRIITIDPLDFLFEAKGARVEVPYERINLLEYGQQVSRRYALAVIVSPILLLSKSRKHFLTVSYVDEEGRQQAMVFQVHKSDVRAVLASLEAKTGIKVEYQDNEARRAESS